MKSLSPLLPTSSLSSLAVYSRAPSCKIHIKLTVRQCIKKAKTAVTGLTLLSDKLALDVILQGKGSMTTYWLLGRRDGVIDT